MTPLPVVLPMTGLCYSVPTTNRRRPMTRNAIGWSLRRLSEGGVISTVLSSCLVIAYSAMSARGDDAEKTGTGRILIRAQDIAAGVPAKDRFVGYISVDPESGKWKRVGEPGLVGGALSPDGRF